MGLLTPLDSDAKLSTQRSGLVCLRYSQADAALAETVAARLEHAGLGSLLERQPLTSAHLPALGPDDYWLQIVSKEFPIASLDGIENAASPVLVLLRADAAVSIPNAVAGSAALTLDLTQERCEKSLQELVRFFQREAAPAIADPSVSRGDDTPSPMQTATCRQVRLVAQRCLDETALRSFLLDAELPLDALGGGTVKSQIINLLHLLSSQGTLEHFADWLGEECPGCVQAELDRLKARPDFGLPISAPRRPAARVLDADRSLIFISYHPDDERVHKRIRVHLQPYERRGEIQSWDIGRVLPGQDVQKELQALLERARVAVLLISADYLASPAIEKQQLQPLLDAAEKDGVLIVPIAVKLCLVRQDVARYQMVTPPGKTLADLRTADRERVYQRLVAEILAVVEQRAS